MALIAALAFGAPQDAAASDAPTETPAPPRVESASAPALPPPSSATSRHDNDSAGEHGLPGASSGFRLEIGGGGVVDSSWAPNGDLAPNGFVRFGPDVPGAWSLRLAGFYGLRTSSVEDRRAEFTFFGGRAEGCPVSWRLPLNLSSEACVAIELGELRGRGDPSSALLEGASRTIFWAAAVAVERLRARIAPRLTLEGQAELTAPLVRREFAFDDPRERIFRVPALGWGAGLGLGMDFL